MRTNIVLDDRLVSEAFNWCKAKSKRELIDVALREFVANHSRLDLRDLKGRVELRKEYDYKALRRRAVR